LTDHPASSAGTPRVYRGRLAPSPTGYFHLGHLSTFDRARQRAEEAGGGLILRCDDLDAARCKPEFIQAMYDDLRWFGFSWSEGPDVGGLAGPYEQSRRGAHYRRAWENLRAGGWLYPCRCSRKDILANLAAPHEGEEEPIYPGTCRPDHPDRPDPADESGETAWRFQVPDGERVVFHDENMGRQSFTSGVDFGDFVVWRRDGLPSYHLAAVVDDAAMGITDVVRGADLLLSTARQILLIRALQLPLPSYYHCPLIRDENGRRLAKRHASLSLRALRQQGHSPDDLRVLLRNKENPI
jgi:glutamyl/glutaminyl-tRNA synthetase